jgi:hypothetical protein
VVDLNVGLVILLYLFRAAQDVSGSTRDDNWIVTRLAQKTGVPQGEER